MKHGRFVYIVVVDYGVLGVGFCLEAGVCIPS